MHSFLLVNSVSLYGYVILFIYSSADDHLNCFHFLAIMNNAAVNIHVQVLVWSYVFISLGQISMSGIAGSYGRYTFNFLRNIQNIFQSGFIKWPVLLS